MRRSGPRLHSLRRHTRVAAWLLVLAMWHASILPPPIRAQEGEPAGELVPAEGPPQSDMSGLGEGDYDESTVDALGRHFAENETESAGESALPTELEDAEAILAALPKGGGAISPQATAMPTGPATNLGMGESFSTHLSSGGVSYMVPFSLAAARGLVQPRLDLTYTSSGGFGLAGVGWSIGASAIQRQTDRGVPRYDDRADWHAGQDRFLFGGAELVPICTVAGASCSGAQPGEVMPAWADGWQYFRARIEGGFLRFFWSPDHLTWRVQGRDGSNMELGLPLDGTGYEGGLARNPDRAEEVFAWHLVRQYDSQGGANDAAGPTPHNTIHYRYFEDGGTHYLSDIYDTSPAADPTSSDLATFAHHTHLRYEARPDPASSFRQGWLTQVRFRLQGVDVTAKPFEGGTGAPRSLTRRYHLEYDESLHRSLLLSVQMEGRCQQEILEDSDELLPDTACERLPAVRFGYEQVTGPQQPLLDSQGLAFQEFDERVHVLATSPPHSLDEELTALMDIDRNGLPDVLVTAPGSYDDEHGLYLNGLDAAGDRGFDTVRLMGLQAAGSVLDPGGLMLDNSNVAPLDLDADGTIDLIHMPAVRSYSVFSPEETAAGRYEWVGRPVATADGQDVKIDFTRDADQTRVMDVNGDGFVDIVYSSPTEIQTFLSLSAYPGGDGQFGHGSWTSDASADLSTDPIVACAPWSAEPVRFDDPEVHLADMNGDGMADIVRVRSGQILYWPGRGNGFWGTGARDDCLSAGFAEDRHIRMLDAPVFGTADAGTLLLNDVNGDGLSDMVEIRNQGVDIYLNDNGDAWTERYIISETPFRPTDSNYVRLTDIDGSGTPDILWGAAYDYQYIDLNGGKVPDLLTRVENGLGKTVELEYQSLAEHMLAAEADGEPWELTAPISTQVLVRTTTRDNLELIGRPAGVHVTEYSYRDPVFEGRQREFRGFTEAVTRSIGDGNSPDAYQRTVFQLGECPESYDGTDADVCSPDQRWRDNWRDALKGLVAVAESFDAGGVYLSTEHNHYELRQLYTGRDGRRVVAAMPILKDVFGYDTSSLDSE
ncbi:MAG: FG-GAP-like repeat-containing protein [Myxococcales bacterium]|nr:FG-GAP-like repeat-containing protein [Myxococcales bacterium]